MSTDEKRIREFAYQIWQSEGQPDGQEARHWDMARKLAEAEALAPSKPATAKAKPKTVVTPTKSTAKPPANPIAPPVAKHLEPVPKKPRAPRKPAAT
ncbi:hypothetical protein AWM79_04945 [Pseudomonas agarici]|uniref:DUF2934 domain-containing protein n=1 Tax=Pseudomonas agarici TaxID=46677 RepID=A0A0X1SXV7_PSEAA|nr:DUF2934 domain-containing protein [Pseudomonas agarici]AMB84687.1 hypothetical protein AWM79_04945 [Pseudomonas agarici]NWB92548.1 DUF2934 domain-containing protein [Pseudomonas agarici]NWC07625.1 DUF2934 domain-containing protein [Pseudomonas agarici]SEL05641.1 Protein of unknown function [Pseudomonas agarici]